MIRDLLNSIAFSDQELAEEALTEIYVNYGKQILNIANRILHDQYHAEEVLNDILLKVWNNSQFLSKLDNPLGYIITMSYNQAVDLKRKQKELIVDDITKFIDTRVFDEYQLNNTITKIDMSLEMLSELERTIVILKAVFSYTFYQLSKICNLSYKQVRSVYLKSLEKIKKHY